MRGLFNDCLRYIVGATLVCLGFMLELRQRLHLVRYRATQSRLRKSFAIHDDAPVQVWGPDVEHAIERAATRFGGVTRHAETSGSSASPKRLLYPPGRIAATRSTFIDAFARALVRKPFARHSFYIFSSLRQDTTLTSLMLEEAGLPHYLATLQAPDRLHRQPAIVRLGEQYGDTAVRLWMLTLANPGTLYSTNPSTLCAFFDTLNDNWESASALIREFSSNPGSFSADIRRIAQRVVSAGALSRMRRVAARRTPPSLHEFAPSAHTYVCWTGGYVQPFLDRLVRYLPPGRYGLLPMYSMSTETPQTTPVYRGNHVAFVPMAPRVYFEFLPADSPNDPALLLLPHQLEVGREYTMVASDEYGLTRYQTDDVFACTGFVNGVPDLRFRRRATLSYSFTGEKLTGEQARIALSAVGDRLSEQCYLTCVPSVPPDGMPRYLLVAVPHGDVAHIELGDAPARFDRALAELNEEYAAKRASGRLGPISGLVSTRAEFLAHVASGRESSWETQFKFLPLYRTVWERDESGS